MFEIGNFAVLSRGPESPLLSEVRPNTHEYTYVASAINIALSMLETPQARHHLVELALELDSKIMRNEVPGENPANARSAVSMFLQRMRARFPVVIIDHFMTDLNMLGDHPRGDWDGELHEFDPRSQMIYINGKRVNHMIASVGSQGG